ncbi:MAG: glutamine amidotransferase family protein [Nitrospirae bacterium]|nr:glutamine amidotransferase family protein [Nitrospirota bacterium]
MRSQELLWRTKDPEILRQLGKDISGCGLSGIINIRGQRISGEAIRCSIACQHDRGNGLGGGFAAYGIYPRYRDYYALHIMYDSHDAKNSTEDYLDHHLSVELGERIPTRPVPNINKPPLLWRYFVKGRKEEEGDFEIADDEYMVKIVMGINATIPGAFVFSSGKNMGVFKGVGFPEELAEFFMIDEYQGYLWLAHNRFPTNTPGWWGGAHPFNLLDWSIIHNGEISSYGINKRYLEMFGYKLTLMTDTEVVAYLLDLLVRRHKLNLNVASTVLSPPFWKDIEKSDDKEKEAFTALRMVYGSAMLNGPFAFIFGFTRGMVGMNDRIKLRPFVVATKGDNFYMASEEAAIREICPEPDKVWSPRAGHSVIVELDRSVTV